MKRKIYNQLLHWKQEHHGNTAILLEGARRVGKSYIAEEFAKNEYDSYILIDFSQTSPEVKEIFNHYLDKLDVLFSRLQIYYGIKLIPRKSLIIFDEVQSFPRAREAIKYLVADGRFDYIETGSLISIRKNIKDIVIPSEEHRIEMHPMDFEEFLWAMGDKMLMSHIRDMFAKKEPLGTTHRQAMDYFRQYLIVGGMPQAVASYIKTQDFDAVDEVKRDIIDLYREDVQKCGNGQGKKIALIFDQIPGQLQKHEKKFKLSSIEDYGRMRNYEDAFFWLADAQIINCCYNSTAPNIGLRLNEQRSTMKCYLSDTGLLISLAFDEHGIKAESLYKKLMFGKLEVNEGMLVENIVAQMLKASGHKLYFFSNYDAVDSSARMEVDFLIAKSKITRRHNISPIEVKSGKRYTLTSLKKCIQKYGQSLTTPYVIHDGDLHEKEGIIFLPFYMTPCL